jgi:hypothetical protein
MVLFQDINLNLTEHLCAQLPFVLMKTSQSTHVLVEVSVDGKVSRRFLL